MNGKCPSLHIDGKFWNKHKHKSKSFRRTHNIKINQLTNIFNNNNNKLNFFFAFYIFLYVCVPKAIIFVVVTIQELLHIDMHDNKQIIMLSQKKN